MKSKHWLIIFFAVFAIGIAGYMGLNYYANPLGYFTVMRGDPTYRSNDMTRKIKTEYLTKHKDEYNAVVIGGSKSGALSCKLLNELTGKSYYNLYFDSGNFYDYLTYAEYLIEHVGLEEITLHLSSFEVKSYQNDLSGANRKVPALVDGNFFTQATEFLGFLMSDLSTVQEEITSNKEVFNSTEDVTNGERNRKNSYVNFYKNPDGYVQKHVLPDYDKKLKHLFGDNTGRGQACDDNIAALKEIKRLCDKNNVTLKVVIGASFLGERASYECPVYYSYLQQMVQITDVWDFSDFNDINMNPYNFIDRTHYNKAVADLELNIMYGKTTREGFGQILTKDNIDAYIQKRMSDFNVLKQEYLATGTVALQTMDDPSFVPVDMEHYDESFNLTSSGAPVGSEEAANDYTDEEDMDDNSAPDEE